MIETAGTPGYRVMAVLTGFCCGNVRIGFTDCIDIIVAALTATGDTGMIKAHCGPGFVGDMAIVTGGISHNMIRRFTGGSHTIVTAGAGTGDDCMVEGYLCPAGG